MSTHPDGWELFAVWRPDPPHETFTGEDAVRLDRLSRVLARCLLDVQDDDLAGFTAGFNRLFVTSFTIPLLVELRDLARDEASR